MDIKGNLLAWIESRDCGKFAGRYVDEGAVRSSEPDAPRRAPAIRVFPSFGEAEHWIASEAHNLGVPLKWLSSPSS